MNMQKQNTKTAIITGATQGIGKAIAEKLLTEGFSITICARSSDDLTQRKAEWADIYPDATIRIYTADFSKPEEVAKFAEDCLSANPQIDILVNNAGIFQPGELATEPEKQLETMMQVNLYSAYHLTRALLPRMKENGSGHIFNLCSVASLKAYPNGGAYSITKYALLGFSDNLRFELMPHNIRVTAISPGATWSRSWSGSGIAEERIMEAQDVATMLWAAYQLSPRANAENIIIRPLAGDL
jgi:short-subunit dehydrogenase